MAVTFFIVYGVICTASHTHVTPTADIFRIVTLVTAPSVVLIGMNTTPCNVGSTFLIYEECF